MKEGTFFRGGRNGIFIDFGLEVVGISLRETERCAALPSSKNMKAKLKEAHRQAIEDSKLEPVPEIVLAYRNVYGMLPRGWPPWQFDQRED